VVTIVVETSVVVTGSFSFFDSPKLMSKAIKTMLTAIKIILSRPIFATLSELLKNTSDYAEKCHNLQYYNNI
jgi:hypothetical protein